MTDRSYPKSQWRDDAPATERNNSEDNSLHRDPSVLDVLHVEMTAGRPSGYAGGCERPHMGWLPIPGEDQARKLREQARFGPAMNPD